MTLPGLEGKKFDVIYADPPWHYSNSGVNGAAGKHYPVMKTKDICALDVAAHTKENCAIFLWATWPNLPEAIKVMEAWGFSYKTCAFLWVKLLEDWDDATRNILSDDAGFTMSPRKMKYAGYALKAREGRKLAQEAMLPDITAFGPGFYTRANTEVCLLGTRGRFLPDVRNVRQVIFSRRGHHSAKPEEARKRIDALAGTNRLDRVELFARGKAQGGWVYWGNDVNLDVDEDDESVAGSAR